MCVSKSAGHRCVWQRRDIVCATSGEEDIMSACAKSLIATLTHIHTHRGATDWRIIIKSSVHNSSMLIKSMPMSVSTMKTRMKKTTKISSSKTTTYKCWENGKISRWLHALMHNMCVPQEPSHYGKHGKSRSKPCSHTCSFMGQLKKICRTYSPPCPYIRVFKLHF